MGKIIFLDFDGVLTSNAYTRQCIFEYRRENLYGLDWFDPDCLAALRAVIDATGAGIVVSSSWRDLGEIKLRHLWDEIPIPGEFAGTTPIWVLTKADAIREYLKLNPCVSYVILDDSDLHLPNQIKTDPCTGLSDSDARAAIHILNNIQT